MKESLLLVAIRLTDWFVGYFIFRVFFAVCENYTVKPKFKVGQYIAEKIGDEFASKDRIKTLFEVIDVGKKEYYIRMWNPLTEGKWINNDMTLSVFYVDKNFALDTRIKKTETTLNVVPIQNNKQPEDTKK